MISVIVLVIIPILTLTHPTCETRTLIEEEDLRHYCMHCGAEVPRDEGGSIDPIVEAVLWHTGALEEEDNDISDYSDMLWYFEIGTIEDKLFEDDFDESWEVFAAFLTLTRTTH